MTLSHCYDSDDTLNPMTDCIAPRRLAMPTHHAPQARCPTLSKIMLVSFVILCTTAKAETQHKPARWTLGTGAHWLSGDYGRTQATRLHAFPLTLSWKKAPWKAKLSTSLVGISGPGSLVDGNPASSNSTTTNSDQDTLTDSAQTGLGDTTATLTWQKQTPWLKKIWLDFSLGVKLPTADENKGLGTGATDVRVKIDMARRWGKLTGFSTLGYKIRGTSDIRPLDNAPWLTLGLSHPWGKSQRLGLMYDHTRPAIDGNSARSELAGFWQHAWSTRWKSTIYLVGGLNDNSPDIGGGFQLAYLLSH